jgi:hypothetical protein
MKPINVYWSGNPICHIVYRNWHKRNPYIELKENLCVNYGQTYVYEDILISGIDRRAFNSMKMYHELLIYDENLKLILTI